MDIIKKFQSLLSENKLEEAEALLDENKQNLDYDDYYAYHGLVLEKKGDFSKALKEYYKIEYVGDRISRKFYHFHLAFCLNALDQTHQALANLNQIEDFLTPKDIALHFQFYITYSNLGNEEKALEHIEAICKVSKEPIYRIYYASSLNNTGNYLKAYTLQKKLYKKFPENSALIRGLCSSSYNLKKYKEAEEYYQKLIQLNQCMDLDYYYLANIYILLEEYKKAIETLKNVSEKNATFFIKCAYCYSEMKNMRMADKYFKKALDENPDNIAVVFAYADFLVSTKKVEDAIGLLKKLKNKNKDLTGQIYYEIAKIKSNQGDFKEAIRILKKGEKEDNHPLILCDIAWNYKQLGDYKNVKKYLEKVEKFLPEDSWILMELASCMYHLGEYEQALEKYLKVDLNNREIYLDRFYYEIGDTYEELGYTEEALNSFLKVEEKEEYTYAHIISCLLDLERVEEISPFLSCLDYKKEEDPWILEVYLDYLTEVEKYQDVLELLKEKKDRIPKIVYLEKETKALTYLSVNRKDPRLIRALENQKYLVKEEKQNKENLLFLATIYNRLGESKEALACLEKVESLGKCDFFERKERVINHLISKEFEPALELSKFLYQNTDKKEALILLAISEYYQGHYIKAVMHSLKLKKEDNLLETVEIILGICYYKMGFRKYGKRLLNPWLKKCEKSDLLNDFLIEQGGKI